MLLEDLLGSSVDAVDGTCGCEHGGVESVIETSSVVDLGSCASAVILTWPFRVRFFPAIFGK
jgi:hypothetical protein